MTDRRKTVGVCSDCGEPATTGDGHRHPKPWFILCGLCGKVTKPVSQERRECPDGHWMP